MHGKSLQLSMIILFMSFPTLVTYSEDLRKLSTRRCSYVKNGYANRMCLCYFYNDQQHIPIRSSGRNSNTPCHVSLFVGSDSLYLNSNSESYTLSTVGPLCALFQFDNKKDANFVQYTLHGNTTLAIPSRFCNTTGGIQTCCFLIHLSSGQSMSIRFGRTSKFFAIEAESSTKPPSPPTHIPTNNQTNGTTPSNLDGGTTQLLTIFIFGIPAVAMTYVVVEKVWLLCRKKLGIENTGTLAVRGLSQRSNNNNNMVSNDQLEPIEEDQFEMELDEAQAEYVSRGRR